MASPKPSSSLDKLLLTQTALFATGAKVKKPKCLPAAVWKNKVEYNTQGILLLTSPCLNLIYPLGKNASSWVALSNSNVMWERFSFKFSSSHIKDIEKQMQLSNNVCHNIVTVIISAYSQYKKYRYICHYF